MLPSVRVPCLALLLVLSWLYNMTAHAAGSARPNIAVFLLDDVGQSDIGAFGNPVIRTPHIDRLAAEGMRFDNAFLTTSSCTASRASILTGLYPHNTGAPGLGDSVSASVESLPLLLKNAGYYTASVGKWHLGEPFKRHFDRVVEMHEDTGSIDWLPELARRPKDKPFFFWFAPHDAHMPYDWTPPLQSHSPDEVIVQPWQSDTFYERAMIAQYYNEIERADRNIGAVIAALRREGVLDNTLVIILSDNGAMFGGAKTSLYDEGLKTPLIMRYPSSIPAQGVNTQLVSSIDLAPTILALAQVPAPDRAPGVSLWPTIIQPRQPVRGYIFAERNNTETRLFERALRTKQFLYKRNYLGRRLCDPANGLLVGSRLKERLHTEFYDMSMDPLASNNLANNPEFYSDLVGHSNRMNRLMHDTGDIAPPLVLEQCEPLPWGRNIQLELPVDANENAG